MKLYIILFSILIGLNSCGKSSSNTMQDDKIFEVVDKHSPELMEIPGVAGVYVGMLKDNKTYCIKVMAEKITPELQKEIPDEIEGYKVLIEETGEIKPM